MMTPKGFQLEYELECDTLSSLSIETINATSPTIGTAFNSNLNDVRICGRSAIVSDLYY